MCACVRVASQGCHAGVDACRSQYEERKSMASQRLHTHEHNRTTALYAKSPQHVLGANQSAANTPIKTDALAMTQLNQSANGHNTHHARLYTCLSTCASRVANLSACSDSYSHECDHMDVNLTLRMTKSDSSFAITDLGREFALHFAQCKGSRRVYDFLDLFACQLGWLWWGSDHLRLQWKCNKPCIIH
jgi:hypothetical protein